jgi:rhodanese-related sulfurtransferase
MIQIKDVKTLSAEDVQAAQAAGRVLIVDAREPGEFAQERIAGAVNRPLSSFEPALLPEIVDPARVVFQCGSGVRSLKAIELCRAAGVVVDSHMGGGIGGWKAGGLPTERPGRPGGTW